MTKTIKIAAVSLALLATLAACSEGPHPTTMEEPMTQRSGLSSVLSSDDPLGNRVAGGYRPIAADRACEHAKRGGFSINLRAGERAAWACGAGS